MAKVHVFPSLEVLEKAFTKVVSKNPHLVLNSVHVKYMMKDTNILPEGRTYDVDLNIEGYSGDYVAYFGEPKEGERQREVLLYSLETTPSTLDNLFITPEESKIEKSLRARNLKLISPLEIIKLISNHKIFK